MQDLRLNKKAVLSQRWWPRNAPQRQYAENFLPRYTHGYFSQIFHGL